MTDWQGVDWTIHRVDFPIAKAWSTAEDRQRPECRSRREGAQRKRREQMGHDLHVYRSSVYPLHHYLVHGMSTPRYASPFPPLSIQSVDIWLMILSSIDPRGMVRWSALRSRLEPNQPGQTDPSQPKSRCGEVDEKSQPRRVVASSLHSLAAWG